MKENKKEEAPHGKGFTIERKKKNLQLIDSKNQIKQLKKERKRLIKTYKLTKEEKHNEKFENVPKKLVACMHEKEENRVWNIYGSKQSIRVIIHNSKRTKKGFGWSGCTPSDLRGWFWVVSDSEKNAIFKVCLETGQVIKVRLGLEHADLESVHKVPNDLEGDELSSDQERFFISCSSSINKQGGSPSELRNRFSLVTVPIKNKELPKHLEVGKSQIVWEDVRGKLLAHLQECDGIEVTDNDAAKHGGLDIEGICFVPGSSTCHVLYFGLRGPQSVDKACVIVPVKIPFGSLTNPEAYQLEKPLITFALTSAHVIRDLCYSPSSDSILVLAGPLHQDKAEKHQLYYPLYNWDFKNNNNNNNNNDDNDDNNNDDNNNKMKLIMKIPRIKNKYIFQDRVTAKKEEHEKEAHLPVKEKGNHFTSPEGICLIGDNKLIVVWDNNDTGLFASVPIKIQ